MQTNKSYIWVSFIVLIFGIYAVPKIIERVKNGEIVKSDRLDNVKTEKAVMSNLYKVGPVPNFSLTDQNNNTITNKSYLGKVYVVEFFFTTCPTICPIMNKNMTELQNVFKNNTDFGIASITINPENDTPAVLKTHASFLKINSPNWHLLTGDKTYVFDLSNKGFNLYAGQNPKIAEGFEHSGLFALVDKNGKIRSRKDDFGNPIVYYDGIKSEGITMIKEDIALLLAE